MLENEFVEKLKEKIENIKTNGKYWKKINNGKIAFEQTGKNTYFYQKMFGNFYGSSGQYNNFQEFIERLKNDKEVKRYIQFKKRTYEQLTLF